MSTYNYSVTKSSCHKMPNLISYIAPAAPATRCPATGTEPLLRPEIGFTPAWFHQSTGINFGERWHTDPVYRRATILTMRSELRRQFPGTKIGRIDQPDAPLDLLTGTFGACTIAGIYGIPILYAGDKWPTCKDQYLTNDQVDHLEPPDLDHNPLFQQLMDQVNWIAGCEHQVLGYMNWQGVLNNAYRLRGQILFFDMIENPARALRLFDCVCTTMIQAARKLQARQRETGIAIGFFTVSNCLVNMISPDFYTRFLLPFDQRLAREFGCIGIHNCAWNANPYLSAYASVPNVGYIDMGQESDLEQARHLFPHARRAIMYTPMALADKPLVEIRSDLERIARHYGPCDIVAADIEFNTPANRVLDFIHLCEEISFTIGKKEK